MQIEYGGSYADAYAAGMAKIHNGILLSGDPEFKDLDQEVNRRTD